MDKRISFIETVKESTGFNTDKKTGWRKINLNPDVWSEYRPSIGLETTESDQLTEVKKATFRIRYRTDITVMNNLVYNNVMYDIESINETVRGRYMELRATEKGVGYFTGSGFTIGYNQAAFR